jgi:ketosteroid isomerase-like protein
VTFNSKHILEGQGGLALSLHNTAERQGKTLHEHLATVCRLRDDRICSIDTYLSDVDMADSFFVLTCLMHNI